MPISMIVSGGQTGADRAGLDAAIQTKVAHGGWCPKGRRAEDGTIPSIYRLQESSSSDYLRRTEANVTDSDSTLIFTFGNLKGGSRRTSMFAAKQGKPCLHIDLTDHPFKKQPCTQDNTTHYFANRISDWLSNISLPDKYVINVAGNRESKCPGIQSQVCLIMINVIAHVNKSQYPVSSEG